MTSVYFRPGELYMPVQFPEMLDRLGLTARVISSWLSTLRQVRGHGERLRQLLSG